MYRKLSAMLVLAALGFSAVPASAFFEDVAVSPRSRGMGETGVTVPDGPYAAFHNPGQLAENPLGGVAASYVRPFGLSYTDYYFVGVGLRSAEKRGGFGLGFSQFKVQYDDVDLQDETRVGLSYGHRLYGDMHSTIDVGLTMNWYHVKQGETVTGVDPGNDSCLGFDLGFLFTLHKRTRLGFLVKNLNNPNIGVDEEELPQQLAAGLSYEPYTGVITTFEVDNELGRNTQYKGGAEMVIFPGFALRAGVITNPNKVTMGFGIDVERVVINYGFSTGGGVLDSTHQFGINLTWGGEAQ